MHRRAAPFSRGEPKAHPKRPGRPVGHRPAHRPAPPRVDQVLDAPLPQGCPDCGATLVEDSVQSQFQTDMPPVTPVTTLFNVHVGHCCGCGKRVQGRHPFQSSQALGAASVQLGPRVVAMGLEMHIRLGLSFRKLADYLVRFLGLQVAPATFARAMRRLATRMRGTVEEIRTALRASTACNGDGTGWRVGGHPACLHTVCTKTEALYLVENRWGAEPTIEVLGKDYAGVFGSDGLRAFERLTWRRQRCHSHLLRFAREIEADKTRGAVRDPRAITTLLKDAIALGKRREDIGEPTLLRGIRALERRLHGLLFANLSDRDNARLRGRLWTAAPHLFTFLEVPGVEPTNNEAERTLRPAVIARKLSAGNRTWEGARAWAALASVIETSRRRGQDFTLLVLRTLRAPGPQAQPAFAAMTR